MNNRRQKTQYQLAFVGTAQGEAQSPHQQGTELLVAKQESERSVEDGQLMEEICKRENMMEAWKRVRANKGSPGVDGRTIDETWDDLRERWPMIREQLLNGTYQPQPVRRVEIPKPDDGVRKLGIPTVLDRLIQQAVHQVLQRRWDPTFSEHSYGFRPGRTAHQAVARAQQYVADGFGWVVDLDLEKFFDRVNHDLLMDRVAKRESDKRLLKLIRAFLNAGVMENGLVSPTGEGTPQGGPLSPLLSNLMLDELDRELERRGHRFCRYADDSNVYVRSRRAGERVMEGICHFVTDRLRLKVNETKSAVARPGERKFLGFTISNDEEPIRQIAPEALRRFMQKVRELTKRTQGISIERMVEPLAQYLKGWRGYFSFCQTPSVLFNLDARIRRRLRMVIWRDWRTGRNRYTQLRRRGVPHARAAIAAGASNSDVWRMSRHAAVQQALPNAYFDSLGLPRVARPSST
jgi:RNA-directed DNA polymerase